jgi:copper homeostasis protein
MALKRHSTLAEERQEQNAAEIPAVQVVQIPPIVFELCAEGIDAWLTARDGGANRIELCTGLSEGGLTPSHALLEAAVQRSGLPVYVLVRPRGGNFVYSEAEFALMERDMQHARQLGASGFVIGVLKPDGSVDQARVRRLVAQADGLEVTFHRAFDDSNDLEQALEDVIATGCRRILTSGGAKDVLTGADRIGKLVDQADGRIAIAAGKGLTVNNAAEVARRSRTRHFHGSLLRRTGDAKWGGTLGNQVVDPEDIRSVVRELSQADATLTAD